MNQLKEFETITEKTIKLDNLIENLNYKSQIRILDENFETLFAGYVYQLFDNHNFDMYTLLDINFLPFHTVNVTVKAPRVRVSHLSIQT